jgi:hypothetical protein
MHHQGIFILAHTAAYKYCKSESLKLAFACALRCMAINIISTVGNEWAGVLRLNRLHSQRSPLRGKSCQLVELSAERLTAGHDGKKTFDEWDRFKLLDRTEDYEFYNVLRVAWKERLGREWLTGELLGELRNPCETLSL